MLAKRRRFRLATGEVIETPLLLPSFSSKYTSYKVRDVMKYMEGIITEEILISAYDLHHGHIPYRITFPSVVFLDSGGYEASEDVDLSDAGKRRYRPDRTWKQAHYKAVLAKWRYDVPTVVVSFDSPASRKPIEDQISRAKSIFRATPNATREILFKAHGRNRQYIDVDHIIQHRHALADFDIIGFTEKELAPSMLGRMVAIAKLRNALNEAGLDCPVHVFGSLDPVSSPLYYFAGADIFDGLTWLRYAFHRGFAVYKHNYGSKEIGVQIADVRVNAKVWNDNYYYMERLKNEMIRFLETEDFAEFETNGRFFHQAVVQFNEQMRQRG